MKEEHQNLKAQANGYDDFTSYGYDVPCPYELGTKEASYWTTGFNEAVADKFASDALDWEDAP